MNDRSPGFIESRYRELQENFAGRNIRMDEWEIAYRQLRPRSQPGYTPIPSNIARTTVDFVTSILSGKDSLQIHVPVIDDSDEAQSLGSQKEWFLRGVFTQFDRTLPRVMRHPSLQFNLAQDIALRGWFAVRPLLIEGAANPFQLAVYDPRQTVHWSREDGLLEFASKQKLRWSDVWGQLSQYLEDKGIKPEDTAPYTYTDVIDYWVNRNGKIYNVISVNNEIVKDEFHADFDEIPIIIGPVAGVGVRTGIGELDMPFHPNDPFSRGYYDQSYISTAGLSVADGVLAQSQAQALIMSLLMSNFEKWVNPPKIVYVPDNAVPTLDFSPDGVNFVPYSSSNAQPTITELRHNGPPPETVPLLQQLDASIQRGSIPYAFYGALSQNLSGFAVNQLLKSAGYIATSRGDALCYVYQEMCRMLLKQYSKFSEPLSGIWYYDQKVEKTRYANLSPTMLQPTGAEGDLRCDVNVNLRLDLPTDMIQRANIAQILRSGQRGAVSSHLWVLENVLQVDDSYKELEALAIEAVELDPANPAGPQMKLVKALSIYEKRAANGDIQAQRMVEVITRNLGLTDAQLTAATNQATMAAAPQGAGGPPGAPMLGGPPTGEMAAMNPEILPEGGAPPGFPGVNGQVQPPVMSGAVPMGQVPLGDQGVPEEEASIMDQLLGLGVM